MLFFQGPYNKDVNEFVAQKLQESSTIDSDKYLYYILLASALFFCISFSMTLYMVIRRFQKNKTKATDDLLIEKYQNFLSNMLILPVDNAFLGIKKTNETEFRLSPEDVTNKHSRKILLQEIYELKKALSGSQESQLTNYFFGLGLQAEVFKMIKSRNLEKKMQAMKMIHSFNIIECQELANQYIHSPNRDLAILAIQNRIKFENSINVLYEIKVKLNDWECHKILFTVRSMNIPMAETNILIQELNTGNINLERLSIGFVKKEKNLVLTPVTIKTTA